MPGSQPRVSKRRRLAGRGRSRGSARPFVVVLLVLAASALLILAQNRGLAPGPGLPAAPPAGEASVSSGGGAGPESSAGGVEGAATRVATAGPASDRRSDGGALSSGRFRFAVAIGPPVLATGDSEMDRALETFQSSLMTALREIPHLDLIAVDTPADDGVPDAADFRLRVGGATGSGPDPLRRFRVSWETASRDAGSWSKSQIASDARPVRAIGEEAAEALRRFPFPPEETRTVDLQALALDSSVPGADRIEALEELRDVPRRFAFVGRDAERDVAVAAAAIVAQSPEPDIRRRVWLAMAEAGIADPYLTQPLIDSALNDSDESVRLAAVRLLASAFEEDSRTLAALEYAMASDPSPSVRANARWEVLDEAERRAYVSGTLLNPDLSDAERLELLVADVGDLHSYVDRLSALTLARMAGDARANAGRPSGGEAAERADAAQYSPLLIELLQEGETEEIRIIAASILARYVDDPSVRGALERAAREDRSFAVRGEIERSLRR